MEPTENGKKEVTNGLALGGMMENSRYNKPTALYDQNVTRTSENSNNSEISRAMEKIAKTNQLMAQQQVTQQRALQAMSNDNHISNGKHYVYPRFHCM